MLPEVRRTVQANRHLNDMRETIERGKRLGLISAAGEKKKIQLSGEAAQHNGVRIQFCNVTPELAKQWLANNTGNRKLKDNTVEGYARDMANGDWLTTHQGIAFNEDEQLIDGQHRLEAIVRSGVTVVMLVSHGWPVQPKDKKVRTMDTVDRGAVRSLSDLLKLQHNMDKGHTIVAVATILAQVCVENPQVVRKLSMPTLLAIVETWRDQIKFALDNAPVTQGLRQAPALGAMAFLHAINPAKAAEFWESLKTGENLNRKNPILHVRNFLLADAKSRGSVTDRIYIVEVVTHAFQMWSENLPCERFTHAKTTLAEMIATQPERVSKIRQLFAITPPR
jgi:hypothetical protein